VAKLSDYSITSARSRSDTGIAQPERLRGLEIYDELDHGDLLDRQSRSAATGELAKLQ
jgi:hypothetical protein